MTFTHMYLICFDYIHGSSPLIPLFIICFPSVLISFFIPPMGEVYLLNFSGVYRNIDTLPVAPTEESVSSLATMNRV